MKRFFLSIILLFNICFPKQSIVLTERHSCDLELILSGGFAPLTGFLEKNDYDRVVQEMRLADGTLWPMPIILDVDQTMASKLQNDRDLDLRSPEGLVIATMQVREIWQPDKLQEAQHVFGTTNAEHPGVDYLFNKTKSFYVGGPVTVVNEPKHADYTDLRRTPTQLKQYFAQRGIDKIVAFQTRNPMHRAHQELTFRAAKSAKAHLLIQPVVGLTKPGDIDYKTRVRCYKALLKYYPEGSVTLSLLPLAMRMAGPREALWHAIIRKNHGVTHFIIGRDHAGPGKDSSGKLFYGPYDSQEMVKRYASEVGITVVPFQEVVYVPATDSYHPMDEISDCMKTLTISGTQLRGLLLDGKEIPTWFTFPEVAQELSRSFPPRSKQGFTIFFTGLSGSGKSTIAKALAFKLEELQNRSVTLLDGDIVRTYLSSELGFSKEHRSLNVRRVGFVASEISKNGGVAICSLIAPYEVDRQHARALVTARAGYIEVYISTSLEVCEGRDVKGLYEKARAGIIPNFTGISDPYEIPIKPELVIDTEKISVEESVQLILDHLQKEGFIN